MCVTGGAQVLHSGMRDIAIICVSWNLNYCNCRNKSSAVAEMGDRARAKWAEKWRVLYPFPWGAPFCGKELGPHLVQCRLGRGIPPYQVASWSIQPFGHSRHWAAIESAMSFPWGSWVPKYNTIWLGRGLSPYKVASWSIQPFSHNIPTLQDRQTDKHGAIANGRP